MEGFREEFANRSRRERQLSAVTRGSGELVGKLHEVDSYDVPTAPKDSQRRLFILGSPTTLLQSTAVLLLGRFKEKKLVDLGLVALNNFFGHALSIDQIFSQVDNIVFPKKEGQKSSSDG